MGNLPQRQWLVVPKCVIGVVLLGGLFAALRNANLQHDLLRWIDGFGIWGPAVFILVYILASVVMFPGSLLTLGAGIMFGLSWGFLYVWIGSTLGAVAAFLIARFVANDYITRKATHYPRFAAINRAIREKGWTVVLLTRLSPVIPFNLLNYALGITPISLRDYTTATAIGMLPGIAMYVYIGSLAGSLVHLNSPGRSKTRAEWILFVAGLVATVALTVIVTRRAKKVFQRSVSG